MEKEKGSKDKDRLIPNTGITILGKSEQVDKASKFS